MTARQRDTGLPIDDLLARIRACIGSTPKEAIVSLTINVERTGEKTVFRLSVRPDGNLVFLLSDEPAMSTSSVSVATPVHPPSTLPPSLQSPSTATPLVREESPSTPPPPLQSPPTLPPPMQHCAVHHDVSHRFMGVEMDSADSRDGIDNTTETMNVDKDDDSDGHQRSARLERGPSASHDNETIIASVSPADQSTSSSNNIRRSARQQHSPDRLNYPASSSRLSNKEADRSTSSQRGRDAMREQDETRSEPTRKRAAVHADAEDSTDADSAESSDLAWTSSSSDASPSKRSTQVQHQKRRRKYQNNAHAGSSLSVPSAESDGGEEDQVSVLVMKLKDAHSKRVKDLDLETASKQAVVQLGRDILVDQAGDNVALYQQCALKIDHLICTSTAMRMLGYYLRGALAAQLKRSHKSKYVRSARTLLGLKSSADITACPAFYHFVQQHCLVVASGVMDLEAWLQEPIFLADIGWAEWRRYLGKSHRYIIDAAMEQFKASLQPAQDWMQRGWVETYDDHRLGRGVRATRDIPLPAASQRRDSAHNSAQVADLNLLSREQQQQQQEQAATAEEQSEGAPPFEPWYRVEWEGGKQHLDAEQLWVGKINHLPMPHCNLKLLGNGKLVQLRGIAAGEALTFDYGVHWWVHRVSGVTWNEWMTATSLACQKGNADLFYRMHESVLDYTPLLDMGWDKRLSEAASELDREMVVMEMWECVNEREEDGEAAV